MFDEPTRRRATFVFLAVLALGTLGREVQHEVPQRFDRTRVVERYAELLPLLPADVVEVAWTSDEPGTQLAYRRHYEAQFALAPRIVKENAPSLRFTIADIDAPGGLEAVCARDRLQPVKVLPNGACLLEPRKP